MTDPSPAAPETMDNAPRSFRWAIYLMGVAAFASIVAAHVFYWLSRGGYTKLDGSTFGEDTWGQYGDFIGGVTNPFISLLTFGGLLYTILVQRRELALQQQELKNSTEALRATKEELRQTKEIAAEQVKFNRIESRKSEIAKVLALLSAELDEALSFKSGDGYPTVRQALLKSPEESLEMYRSSDENRSATTVWTDKAITSLRRLGKFSQLYSRCEQQSPLTGYYGMKYRDVVYAIYDTKSEYSEELVDLIVPKII